MTLDIDDDVLEAAPRLAGSQRSTTGKVLSDLARQALPPVYPKDRIKNGVPLLDPRMGERRVSLETVRKLYG